jgi:hypothetical protein
LPENSFGNSTSPNNQAIGKLEDENLKKKTAKEQLSQKFKTVFGYSQVYKLIL